MRCRTWCYTGCLPTKRPRHTVTEVGLVESAFEDVRRLGLEPDPRDLMIRGAAELVSEITKARAGSERRRALGERLIQRATHPDGVDKAAAVWAHEESWARNMPDD